MRLPRSNARLAGRLAWALALGVSAGSACEDAEDAGSVGRGVAAGARPTFDLRALRARIEDAERLRPDARFLAALAEIESLATGTPGPKVTARWTGRDWVLRRGAEAIGRLPEHPDWNEALALCVARAERLLPSLRLAPAPATSKTKAWPVGPAALARLRAVDEARRLGRFTVSALRDATRALVSLAAFTPDHMELGDVLAARAFAALALAQAASGAPLREERVFLAEVMGYGRAADAASLGLHPDHPLQKLLRRDHAALAALARDPKAPAYARLLGLRDVASNSETEDVLALAHAVAERAPELTVAGALLEGVRFGNAERVASLVVAAVRRELSGRPSRTQDGGAEVAQARSRERDKGEDGEGGEAGVRDGGPARALEAGANEAEMRPELGALLEAFEDGAARVAARARGPFVDGPLLSAVYAAPFYSALSVFAHFYLDDLSSTEAAARFGVHLRVGAGPRASDFQKWYARTLRAKQGKLSDAELERTMNGLPSFGSRPLRSLYDRRQSTLAPMGTTSSRGLHRLLSRMDTRVAHRRWLAREALDWLRDLPLCERLSQSIVDAAPGRHPSVETRVTLFARDLTAIRRLAADRRLPPESRVDIWVELDRRSLVPEGEAIQELDRLVHAAPLSFGVAQRVARHQEEKGRFALARSILGAYLVRRPNEGLASAEARVVRARLFRREGRLDEAWEEILSPLQSWKRSAIEEGALIAATRGHPTIALALAERARARYPRVSSPRATEAEVLWRLGRADEAARTLARAAALFAAHEWRYRVGYAFAEVYGHTIEAGVEAFSSLERAGLAFEPLVEIAYGAQHAKAHALAFTLLRRFRLPGARGFHVSLTAFEALRDWRGERAAKAWLEKRAAGHGLGAFALAAFSLEHDDVAWTLLHPGPRLDDEAEVVWLVRAAAAARSRKREPERLRRLAARYAEPKGDHRHRMGRFLIGLDDETAMLREPHDRSEACEVAYYLGARAQGEGRWREASAWMRVAVETEATGDAEHNFARNTLFRWFTEKRWLGARVRGGKGARDATARP